MPVQFQVPVAVFEKWSSGQDPVAAIKHHHEWGRIEELIQSEFCTDEGDRKTLSFISEVLNELDYLKVWSNQVIDVVLRDLLVIEDRDAAALDMILKNRRQVAALEKEVAELKKKNETLIAENARLQTRRDDYQLQKLKFARSFIKLLTK